MKIACPSCSAKYSIADEKVQNRLAKIRCRKCGTTIVIDGKASPPTVQAAGSSVNPQAASVSHAPAASVGPGVVAYTVDISEQDQRTMTVPELVDAYNTGVVAADTYVWKEGMPDWAPLADVPEINEALHAAAASQPPAAQAPAPAIAAHSFAAPEEPVRAASRADQKADLFGGIDTAGSAHDTGGQQEADAGVTTATTGARNESSVLFSLSALTGGEEAPPTPSMGGGGAGGSIGGGTTEDSGLIDLAALTAAAESMDASQSMDLGSAPLAAGPLGAAPLTGGTTAPLGVESQIPPPSTSKNGLFIGGGIAVAAVVGGLVFLLKEEPPPAPAIPPPPATVVVTVPAPTAEKPEEDKAEAADTDEKDDKKEAQTPKRTYKAKPRPRPPTSGPAPKSSPSPAPQAKPKPKPKSRCNCKPNDLMCAMKCSTK